jgi:MtN3 and saliva related transmembrane protein
MGQLEIVGFLAGLLVAVALAPQLIKSWKTKSVKDISIVWTLIFMAGLLLWVVYAVVNVIVPLAIFAFIEFSMTTTLFIFKLVYR